MATLIVEDRDQTALISCGVCLRCGQPSDLVKNHKFTWYPQWVSILAVLGLLLFCLPLTVAIVLAGTRRKWLKVPLCYRHANHWMWRLFLTPLISVLGLIAFVALLAIVAGAQAEAWPNRGVAGDLDPIGLFCGAGFFLGVVWLVVVSFLQSGAVRPLEITDAAITLTNVSAECVQSFRDQLLRPGAALDDYVREHWCGTKPRPEIGGQDRIRGRQDEPEEPPPDAIREGD